MTHHELVRKWLGMNGDKTLRLDYDLNEDSIVIDGGGYVGQWASDIYDKYKCTVHVFEPVTKYYDMISKRFENNDKVHVHKVGLSNDNKEIDISLSNDASSVHTTDGPKERIKLVDINEFFNGLGITKVDLMKLNVEGEEYNILDRVIEANMLNIFTDLQIQFHRYSDDHTPRKEAIEKEIKKTFTPTYEYDYVWVNYRKNG